MHMNIQDLLQQRNISKYRLSQKSGIPYTTLNDLCNGKTRLEKCTAETVYKLAKELDLSMESLLTPSMEDRCSFELFKSNVCHRLKQLGDVDFLIEILEADDIRRYYDCQWYPESFYLLAMLDYISRENNVPLCEEYNDLRMQSLSEPLSPAGLLALAAVANNEQIKEDARLHAIPEFKQFNIIENEVRDVIGLIT